MKKLAFILSTSVALVSTAFAQTAVDVEATDTLNRSAEIRVTESVVKATEVADDAVRVEETVVVSDIAPNQQEKVATPLGFVEGRWLGVVPCASCPGIDVDLTLNSDGSFNLIESYQESTDGVFNSAGTATYDPEVRVLTLTMPDGSTRVMSLQEEQLLYIDADGNPQADYMLKRAQ